MKHMCNFCGREIEFDKDDEESMAKATILHVWMYHDETHLGIPLIETLKNGPTYGDDRDSEE
tara:strand:- start:95 stop:280 length:186 start_codon:yes stop_codon:yes gene_type:complete